MILGHVERLAKAHTQQTPVIIGKEPGCHYEQRASEQDQGEPGAEKADCQDDTASSFQDKASLRTRVTFLSQRAYTKRGTDRCDKSCMGEQGEEKRRADHVC